MSERTPHVAHLSSALIWRGAEQQIIYLYQGLQAKGIRQTIFCRAGGSLHARCLEEQWPHVAYRRESGINIGLTLALHRFCKTEQVDLFHVHDPHAHNGWLWAFMSGLNIPAVIHRRVDFATVGHLFNRYKYNHPGVKSVVCVSGQIRDLLLPAMKYPEKVKVMYPCVDTVRFSIQPSQNVLERDFPQSIGKKKVVSVAALVDHKDHPTFIKMAGELVRKRQYVHFFIVGKGALDEPLKALVEKEGLSAYISFTGHRNDIPAVLAATDVYVFTSKMEGFGSTLLEVMSAGVPIAGTHCGGAAEILEHSRHALICEVGDFNALSKHVEQILSEDEAIEQMIKNAYDKAKNYSLKNYTEKMLMIYNFK